MATEAAWLNGNRLTERRKKKCALTSTGLLMEGVSTPQLSVVASEAKFQRSGPRHRHCALPNSSDTLTNAETRPDSPHPAWAPSVFPPRSCALEEIKSRCKRPCRRVRRRFDGRRDQERCPRIRPARQMSQGTFSKPPHSAALPPLRSLVST